MHVVPRALQEAAVVADPSPFLSAVVRPVEAAAIVIGFDLCINAVGFGARYRDAYSSQDSFRKPAALQSLPGRAAVRGFVQPAAGTATREAVGSTISFPQ